MRAAALVLCLALTACTQFPELDGAVTPDLKNADFPALVPLDPLRAQATAVVGDPVETTNRLENRVAALRARAAALQRRPIVDASTRSRFSTRLN